MVGRYPDNSNEVRISDYSYDIYSKKFPNLDFNGVLEQVSSLIREKRSWLMPLSDVGVYKGREWNELDEASVKARKKAIRLTQTEALIITFFQTPCLAWRIRKRRRSRNTIAITYGTQNLVKINDSIRKAGGIPAKPICVICGLTNAAYKRKDGVYVAPIISL